jgi:hypothetical protein
MKYTLLIFVIVLAMSCKQNDTKQSPTAEQANTQEVTPNWLIGSWERVGEKEGKRTYEKWKQDEDGKFIGLGCTLKGVDTIWKEDILLSKDIEGWKFSVLGLGDTSRTSFLVTHMDKKRFICKNELNEFPKKIDYAFDGKNINAVISGGGPTVLFIFNKID